MSCDLLVAGAGPAGAAAAIAAAGRGLRVMLLHDARGSAWPGESLPPGMAGLVDAAFGPGLLDEARHLIAYGTRSCWGSDDLIETDFLANPLGGGWLLDRARFDADARARAEAAGATLVTGRLEGIASMPDGWEVTLRDGRRLAARFVLDATGRAAAVARHVGSGREAFDRQVALVATLDDADPYRGTSVEAVADGWWYTTPLPGGRRVLAFLTDADLLGDGVAGWARRLEPTIHVRRLVGEGAGAVVPRTSPAETAAGRSLHGPRWCAAGDAAMTFDPLSSQGISAAILMGARAGGLVAAALAGEGAAFAAWAEDYRTLQGETADLGRHYALMETRWRDAPFWSRRRSAGPL
ncbi:NAD(P)/FAD-dependent oxidoreductase [Xanthobacter flavus]|uniref:NAD(P)/FAD-dependent oxidoreductase n=1 Tax=Xanthobacter flavus TaxID=281 RepID=UPI00372771FD